jgi:hypothetical protein
MNRQRTLVVALAAASLMLSMSAFAVKPPAKKKPNAEAEKPGDAQKPPVVTSPVVTPEAVPATPETTELPPPAHTATPFGDDGATDSAKTKEDEDTTANFQGLFLKLGLGYGTVSGTDGPAIPEITCANCLSIPALALLRNNDPARYKMAVTTNKGSGLATGIEFGYNVLGYGSIALDLAWQGSPFGSSTDNAGVGLGGGTIGFHPLRFVKKGKFPLDLRLYGGITYGVNYYYENALQVDAKGKAWTGTAPLWGFAAEYMFKRKGIFALGLDVRNVLPGWTKWYYNYDKDQVSHLDQATPDSGIATSQSTSNWVVKLMFCWHFSSI